MSEILLVVLGVCLVIGGVELVREIPWSRGASLLAVAGMSLGLMLICYALGVTQ